jgi:CelD/BcsL family acetyltransferase involved in cellulose biosynthesis
MKTDAHNTELEQLRDERRGLSAEIGRRKARGEPAHELIQRSQALSERIRSLENRPAPAAAPQEFAVTTLTQPEDLVALRDEWRTLCDSLQPLSLFSTWEWLSAWYEAYADRGQMRCVVVREGQRLVGAAPLFLPDHSDSQLRAGELGWASTFGRAWGFYLEPLLAPGYEEPALRAVFEEMLTPPRSWHSLRLTRMWPQSQAIPWLLRELPRSGLRAYVRPGIHCVRGPLPDKPEQLVDSLAAKGLRQTIRQARRLAERNFSEVAYLSGADNLDGQLRQMADLSMARKRSQEGSSNFDDPRFRACFGAACHNFQERGWLHWHTLTFDGRTAGMIASVLHQGTFYILQPAVAPALMEYSPGHLLFAHAMEQGIEAGAQAVDLLTECPYKRNYFSERQPIIELTLVADSVRGAWPVARDVLTGAGRNQLKRWLRR